jgi:tRNA A-37 threonylcarbamoyl transferase component Bud32
LHKPVFLTGWLRKSHLLTADEFERLKVGAEILEQDMHGIKVLRLPNGDILKLFRVKHLISSARLFSHARSFCRNAERLRRLGFATVSIKELFHFSNTDYSAVLYRPLPGNTLRQITLTERLTVSLIGQVGAFVAALHQNGVYFRSLHFGNIVQTPQGELGLIDIADMTIKPWRLSRNQRLRNLRHLIRLLPDREQFGAEGWKMFVEAYLLSSGLPPAQKRRFIAKAEHLLSH